MRGRSILAITAVLATAAAYEPGLAQIPAAPQPLSAQNLRIIGHSDLNGKGNGGEGLDMHQYPDGRRVLFYAHTNAPNCVSTIDVTNPRQPKVLAQFGTAASHVRCNSLGVSGTTMVVPQNTDLPGQPLGGMRVYDVADPANPREIAFLNTSGGKSRGAHYVWFADGEYAYLSSGHADFDPAVPPRGDDQFLMIVDMRERTKPREIGRWWVPGQRAGEPGAPLPRTRTRDGVRMHTAFISPERPDRLYAGWIDGGIVILDISDKTRPALVGQRTWYPKTPGYIGHSFLPIFERNIGIVAQEANEEKCADWPKPIWTVDISNERAPMEITQFPYPQGLETFCKAGRFGAHNIHMNRPKPLSAKLTQTVVAAFQNAGVRVYSIADPKQPLEIGHLIPPQASGHPLGELGVMINDVYVDEKGIIYAADRNGGGLWILEYTGRTPLR